MPDPIWNFPRLNQQRFAAAALALAYTQKHQDPEKPLSVSHEGFDDELSDEDSISPRDLVRSSGKGKLLQKFLNRLAEVFTTQKIIPNGRPAHRNNAQPDADHVTATRLGFRDGTPIVHVAKNAGLDEEDRKLLSTLQVWLRAIAESGQRRLVEKDIVWNKLVDFNQVRLEFYVSELASLSISDVNEEIHTLLERCMTYERGLESSMEDPKYIIGLTFDLRYRRLSDLKPNYIRRIALLSRMRAAWETLVEFALHHVHCRHIELREVECGEPLELAKKDVKAELEGLRPGLSREHAIHKMLKSKQNLRLHTHAEMQLLLLNAAADHMDLDLDVVPYIGSSKKTCWLCEQVLQAQGYFTSRGSHGEISAHWTIMARPGLKPQSLLGFTEALYNIQEAMLEKLKGPPEPQRPAIPQSTAAVTTSESAATFAKFSHRHKGRKQSQNAADDSSYRGDPLPQIFGKHLTSITVMRLPADASSPEVVSVDVFDRGPDAKGMGISDTTIDFEPFWGEHHTEQMHQGLEVTENKNEDINGSYIICYMLHAGLRFNEYVSGILGINDVQKATESRHFWHGDVFVVRFGDVKSVPRVYLSLPANCKGLDKVIHSYLEMVWEKEDLEYLFESAREMEESNERSQRNRELVRARLTPLQLDILKHMPLGLESNLEYLAITDGDYDATRNSRVEPCLDDPTKVTIVCERKINELDRIGWKGFTSANLTRYK